MKLLFARIGTAFLLLEPLFNSRRLDSPLCCIEVLVNGLPVDAESIRNLRHSEPILKLQGYALTLPFRQLSLIEVPGEIHVLGRKRNLFLRWLNGRQIDAVIVGLAPTLTGVPRHLLKEGFASSHATGFALSARCSLVSEVSQR